MEVFNVPSGASDISANDNRTVFICSSKLYLRNDSTAAKWRTSSCFDCGQGNLSSNLNGTVYTTVELWITYPVWWCPAIGGTATLGGSDGLDVAVGARGDIWMVNTAGKIYLKAPTGTWVRQQGSDAKRIAVTGTGMSQQAWMVNSVGKVYRASWNGNYYQWTQMAGSSIVDIAAGTDGTVWCCNTLGMIYKWNGTGWTQVPTPAGLVNPSLGLPKGAKRLAVGGGSVWMLTYLSKVYRYYYK